VEQSAAFEDSAARTSTDAFDRIQGELEESRSATKELQRRLRT